MHSDLGKLSGSKTSSWMHLEGVWDWILFKLPVSKIQISESVINTASLHSQRRKNLRQVPKTRLSATFYSLFS